MATLIAFLTSLYLSHLEHIRSLRPSTVLCIYLGFTLLLDLPRIRTLSFLPENQTVTILFAASWVAKAITLVFESIEKRFLLKKAYENSALEATSGIFNRSLFWWLNELLWRGSKTTLTVDDLPILDDELTKASDPEKLLERWNKGEVKHPHLLQAP